MPTDKVRVALTGASGFLGKHVAKLYPDAFKTNGRNWLDLTKERDVKSFFKVSRPDVVIHMAGDVGGIKYNLENQADIYYNNILMNTFIIDQCYKESCSIVFVSSTCAYPAHPHMPTREHHLWAGEPEESNLSYGIAKRVALTQLQAYKQQHGLDYEYLLLSNMYGPFDQSSHVIPDLIKKMLKQPSFLEIWGDGEQTRDFLYVEDAARAIKYFTEHPIGEPVNIANGFSIRLKDLVEYLREFTGFRGGISYNMKQPTGQVRRAYNIDRAKKHGFVTQVDIRDGLRETVKWFKSL